MESQTTSVEQAYLEALELVYLSGRLRADRTGVGSYVVSGAPMVFFLDEGFPVLTTKRVWWKGAFHELLWLLSGKTSLEYLHANNVRYWDPWAIDGDVGPTYGFQWRHFGALERHTAGFDQLGACIENLKGGPPYSRRNVVTAWNPRDIHRMKPGQLPPCHIMYQFVAFEREELKPQLDLVMYQRSGDMFLGVPFDIILYALLQELVAHSVGMEAGQLSIMVADAHIYANHMEQVAVQLDRAPITPPPRLEIVCEPKPIDQYTIDDVQLIGYKHHSALKGEVAV